MFEPQHFPRRILLAVTGLSPQIVTETLYALAVQQKPAFIPSEVHLITTREGADRARLSLLSDSPGGFHRLCKDYRLPEIAFPETNIHVLIDAKGQPLEDILGPVDSLKFGSCMSLFGRLLPEEALFAQALQAFCGGREDPAVLDFCAAGAAPSATPLPPPLPPQQQE